MIYAKTELGQRLFKARDAVLTPRQRSAFILFDGVRTQEQVLRAVAALGVGQADVQHMLDAGLIAVAQPAGGAEISEVAELGEAGQAEPAGAAGQEGGAAVDFALSLLPAAGTRSERQRYSDAYPVAVALTAELGLRGFRLNLAVEAAPDYQALLAVAPRIREAVGAARYRALEQALLG